MSWPTPASTELPVLPGDTTVAFGVADIVVVVCYFAFVLIVGIWVSPLGLLCLKWKVFDPPWGLQRASSAHSYPSGFVG